MDLEFNEEEKKRLEEALRFDELMRRKPPGERVGGKKGKSDPVVVQRRRLAVVQKSLRDLLNDKEVRLKRDLYSLPEFSGAESHRGLSDFVGKAAAGVDLELHACDSGELGEDWLVAPTAWNKAKLWAWLKANAGEPNRLAQEVGFGNAATLERQLEREINGEPTDDEADESASDDDVAALLGDED